MNTEKCEYCGKPQPSYNLVRVDFGNNEYVTLCNECNNQDMALLLGIKDKRDFIKNYIASDADGEKHQFEIRKRIYPMGVCWEANEIKDGEMSGYQFAVHAELDTDQDEALQKLHKKIRKGLSKRHIILYTTFLKNKNYSCTKRYIKRLKKAESLLMEIVQQKMLKKNQIDYLKLKKYIGKMP